MLFDCIFSLHPSFYSINIIISIAFLDGDPYSMLLENSPTSGMRASIVRVMVVLFEVRKDGENMLN